MLRPESICNDGTRKKSLGSLADRYRKAYAVVLSLATSLALGNESISVTAILIIAGPEPAGSIISRQWVSSNYGSARSCERTRRASKSEMLDYLSRIIQKDSTITSMKLSHCRRKTENYRGPQWLQRPLLINNVDSIVMSVYQF